jgi:hypothetical protein
MALDSLAGDWHAETSVLVAHDAARVVRGFLHFVPTYLPRTALATLWLEGQLPKPRLLKMLNWRANPAGWIR